ncbi:MAG: hypothetical protein M1315_00400 [Candidatus Thermoplasmatota archaeon]|nr:hypothetical protein [Candidatus Thermoplasmatota archaeon]
MKIEDILKHIAVQGSILDLDTEVYASIIRNRENGNDTSDLSHYISKVIEFFQDGSLDPWAVDVESMIRLFRSILKDDDYNFALAGNLLLQAWMIIWEKGRKLIEENSAPEEPEILSDDEYGGEEQKTFHTAVVRQIIAHKESRNIMLVDILEAVRLSLKARNARRIQEHIDEMPPDMDSTIDVINPEEPEKEIVETMRRILESGLDTVMMESIWGNTKEEKGPFFSYCLFLHRDGYITMSQERHYSSIYISTNTEMIKGIELNAERSKRQ